MASKNNSRYPININISVCRVCFDAKYSACVQLYRGGLLKEYEFCNNFKMISTNMPLMLCYPCAKKVKEFARFKKQCIKSEIFWKSMLLSEMKCNAENIVLDNAKCEIMVAVSDENTINDSDGDFDEHNFWDIQDLEGSNVDVIECKDYKISTDINELCEGNHHTTDNLRVKNLEELPMKETVKIGVHDKCNDIKDKERTDTFKGKKLNGIITRTSKKTKEKARIVYKCQLCDRKYNYRKARDSHAKRCSENAITTPRRPKCESLSCGLCDYSNADIQEVKKHLLKHSKDTKDLQCQLCEFVGRDFADMLTHRFKHLPKEFKPRLICPLCNEMNSRTIMSMEFHYRSVHLGKPGGLCSVCNKQFLGHKMWRNHEKLHREAKFICDHCGLRFLFRNHIVTHLINHGEAKNFVCEVCGKGCKKKSNLKSHIRNMHTNKTPIPCTHCNKIFKSEVTLNSHLKLVFREKKFVCEVCAKGYPSPNMLKNHMIWHSDARPFACEICGARFKVKEQLKVHMRGHTGDFPFQCDYCEKRFSTSMQKKLHHTVHTGVRLHGCRYCTRTFNSKIILIKHVKQRHPNIPIDVMDSV